MVQRWSIGLAAWVVQDGNYDDFAVGDRAEFAIEFYTPTPLVVAREVSRHAQQVGDSWYEVAGRVVHTDEGGWVIDFGLLAYQNQAPPVGVAVGATVSGRVSLGVDPFFYFENLSQDLAWPALVHTWNVRQIWRETAPFIESGSVLVRDETELAQIETSRTDAWHDDDGHGEYVLVCDHLNVAAAPTSRTARG